MKDSCFIRICSGLSSQELGANSHLKLRPSTALQNPWHYTERLKPLFPLQLFCCSAVVDKLIEPEDLDNFEFNIRNYAQLITSLFISFLLDTASLYVHLVLCPALAVAALHQ